MLLQKASSCTLVHKSPSAKVKRIELPFDSYNSFFEYLHNECEKSMTTYVAWGCASNMKLMCAHAEQKYNSIEQKILDERDDDTLIAMQYFVNENTGKINKKTGKEIKIFKAVNMKHITFIINFISNLLPDIINHRNHLKHYRCTIPEVLNTFENSILVDVDFSENLNIPVKYEPQSLHWCHQQVSVHSGITKSNGEKLYHPYF